MPPEIKNGDSTKKEGAASDEPVSPFHTGVLLQCLGENFAAKTKHKKLSS